MQGFVQNGPTAAVTTGILQPTITLVTAGNGLIAKYSVDAINATIAAPTDSAGQTWQTRSTFANAGGSGGIFYLLNANAGTHTLSFATRAGAQQGGIEEANGLIGPGGTAVSNSVTAATITSPTYTPLGNEYVCAQMFETGTTTPDNIHCNTVAFQSIGTLSDSTPKPCTMINQNGTTQSGVEANSAILSTPVAVTWAWTGSVFAFSQVAGFTLAPLMGVSLGGPHPGRGAGRNSGRFQQFKLSSVNPLSSADVTVSITGQSASFTPGTFAPASAVAISGQSASFTAGTLSPAIAIAIAGQSASFTLGSMVISSALSINGLSASFTPGTLLPQISVALSGQTATFSPGTLTVGSDVTVSITGQTASFTAGSVSPSSAIALSWQSIVSSQGALSPASSTAITALTATFAQGSLTPALSVALAGQTATFTPGTVTVPGDVTVSITGLSATFTPGVMSVAPSVAEVPAGRRRRAIYFVTIDGQRFECGSVEQALKLLAQAKETAKKLAQDKAIWALQLQQDSPSVIAAPRIEAPKISVSSRSLRAAAAQVKREIIDTYAKEMRDAEIRMLLELSKRQSDDDESLVLLM